ncbi:hypothetical protein LCGC14_0461120 [marine sediment metagenome]|uniref:Uncharacterized protein n=1 Tax=marine sediment metagenome TaxID=412755 RepID=A0A0F9SF63_9ZZZZ|nr:hypothetical protein [bacterium]
MFIRHVGQSHKSLFVTDSYLQVHNNYDNYDDQTGINAPLAYESFADALTKAGSNDTVIVLDKAVAITEDETIPATVHLIVRPGGSFAISAGKTLTVSGTIDSCGQSGSTIFTGAGTAVYTTVQSLVGPFELEMDMGENTKLIELWGNATSLIAGSRQGAINIGVSRSSSYIMTSSDGNPDTGLKVTVTNRSASLAYARTRALDITADLRDAGAGGVYVEGMQMTAKTRSGTFVTDVCVSRFIIDHGATGTGSIVGVQIQDNSQSGTGTRYGLLINSTNYNITRENGIFIDSLNGSWVNAMSFNGTITYAFAFENNDGTNGCTIGTYSSGKSANPSGDIKVDVAAGSTKYIYLYENKPTYA